MENFDKENIDKLLEIRQIRQYFPPSKFSTLWYVTGFVKRDLTHASNFSALWRCNSACS